MADNSVRINFIKTFVNTAGVMMDGLQIEKAGTCGIGVRHGRLPSFIRR